MTVVAMPPPPFTAASPSLVPPPVTGRITPDDLLGMDGRFELVNGELREKQMGFDAGDVTTAIVYVLVGHVRANRSGKVVSEVTFRCFAAKPEQVRRPDVAFIAAGRLVDVPGRGHVPVRPDLVIEVVSPGDDVYDLDEKLLDYQSAGVPLVWVFNPEARIVRVHWPDGSSRQLGEADTLDGGDVLPGFTAVVRDLLPPA